MVAAFLHRLCGFLAFSAPLPQCERTGGSLEMVKVFIGQKQMRTSALKLYSLGFRQLNTRSLKAEGPNE